MIIIFIFVPWIKSVMWSCNAVNILLLFCGGLHVCVLVEQLLTGAGELRLINLQEGCADITFTICREKPPYKENQARPGKTQTGLSSNIPHVVLFKAESSWDENSTASGILWSIVVALVVSERDQTLEIRFSLIGGIFHS